MKVTSVIILLVFTIAVTPTLLHAQSFTIDTLNNSIDVSGNFNGGEIHLPAVKSRPDFPGGKKAWQDFLLSNINIRIPVANKAIPGTYKVMIRFIVGSDGKLWGIGSDSNCGYGMELEVMRCINKSVAWIPAETNRGKKVSFTLRTIVIFTVALNDVVISIL
ncbi:MAG: hypothetical protein ABIT96_09785 [Ferruginibacter sp.]